MITINSLGNIIERPTPLSRAHLATYFGTLEYAAFDIDGCLIPKGGLETANNTGTVDKFLRRNKFATDIFRSVSTTLVQSGMKLGLCTGRSSTFAKKIAYTMFTPGTCGYMVAEGGAVKSFFNPISGWADEIPSYLDDEVLKNFNEYKDAIIEIGTQQLGGFLEPGKSVITSFNPPKGVSIEDYRHSFENTLSQLGITGSLSIDNSSSAVDIGPRGSNKATCLLEIVGSASKTAVLVDANNDKGVTEQFLVNLMPKNAQKGIKEIGMQAVFSISSSFNDLYGTIESLIKINELRGYQLQKD